MKVAIHSIQKTIYEGTAEKVICYTPLGQMTVLDCHIPIVSSLIGPAIEIVAADGEEGKIIPLTSGFLEVRPGSEVVILTH